MKPTKTGQGGDELRLSVDAQEAVGLKTAWVEQRKVGDSLVLTGWLTVIPSNEVIIKATTPGFVTSASATGSDPFPVLGDEVATSKRLAAIHVFVSPQEQAQLVAAKEDADAVIAQAEVTMRLIGDQMNRARAAKDAINLARLVELEEVFEKAQAAHREAKEKLPYLPTEPYRNDLALRPVDVASPLTGKITAVHVAPQQFVAAGDPLWTVSDWSQLWLRVPVFEADVPRVNDKESAQVVLPGRKGAAFSAKRVSTPQPTDSARRTVDLYYLVDNGAGTLRPGQAALAVLPTSEAVERIVVPFSAVLWGESGGTWVYLRSGGDEFRRQRVELGRRLGDDVVIERGLDDGADVVVVGAQSLYGEEFKSTAPVDDD